MLGARRHPRWLGRVLDDAMYQRQLRSARAAVDAPSSRCLSKVEGWQAKRKVGGGWMVARCGCSWVGTGSCGVLDGAALVRCAACACTGSSTLWYIGLARFCAVGKCSRK